MRKLLLIIALSTIVSAGCSHHSEKPLQPLVSGVQIETVTKKSADSFYTTSGTVKSKTNSVVSAMLNGRVTSTAVQEGDTVKSGQLLLTIDARDLAQKASGANAGIKAAQMTADSAYQNMKMAEKTYQRYKTLYDEKVISKQEFDQYSTQKNIAASEYQRALAGVQQAQAGLGEVKVYQGYSRVTAPVSGIVTQKYIDAGTTALQGQPLIAIEAPGEKELVANIDESYLDKVKEGISVSLEIGDKTLQRKITKVVKYIDPSTRTFKAKIDAAGLTGGQFAKINIPIATKTAIFVPKTAVIQKGELTGVYTVDDENTISYRLIRTGKTYGENIEVLSGLNDGDKIITVGAVKAIDGGKINDK
ncbi:MAG: efflux RND transporter periplasmic adaptor subunit [Candidatus Gastranaerophilales bacterium]|nr:efflux RND transporter periplasmic adaptor subunit [Candidatus Gastranaerophilales bacterium]